MGEWLRAYLRLSLLPLLAVFGADGVGFEAHPQNSLLHTEGGRPAAFWVRDMEGAHVSRERRPSGLDEDSPLLYDEDEAWRRLRYHLVVNQVAMLVATLGRGAGEEHALWRVVAATLADLPGSCAAAEPYAADLLSTRTLPAKANLTSLFAGHAETPSFVEVANPIHGALA